MKLELSPAQKALRQELRAYFKDLMTPERVAATKGIEGGPVFREVVRQMGKDGVLTLGWPKEFGGQARGMIDQLILFEETWVARAPFPVVTISTIAPALMQFGTPEQKAKYLPGIAAGEMVFAIGYSEAGAGTDLASLKTSAELKDGVYAVNGTKVYTSGADGADYIWLAARTDKGAEPPHTGISVMIADCTDPGFSLAPIRTVAGLRTNVTYYDNVQVPQDNIVGGLNNGWNIIRSQLNHERISLAAMSINGVRSFLDTLADLRAAPGRPLDNPLIQQQVAEIYVRLEAMSQLNWRMAWQIDTGQVDHALASGVKVFSTVELVEVMRRIAELNGAVASIHGEGPASVQNGYVDEIVRMAQLNTFGGGAAEVMRSMVASMGLGMPNTISR